ncbi:MAG: Glucose-6-phosphate 1-dehydrogenase, partial [uncultured Pseudonocardia sp.]
DGRTRPHARLAQPAPRRARQAVAPHRGPERAGDLRGHRRPVAQEAHARHLRPGQPRPAAARLRAHRLRPPRLGRAGLRPRRVRGGQGARAHPVPAGGVGPPRRGLPVRAGQLRRRRRLRPARGHRPRAGRGSRHRGQPRLLPVDPAERLPGGVQAARPLRAGAPGRHELAPGRHREAVRPRPDLGQGAQRDRQRRVPRGVGVPHRPLPRQGDRPEHPGAALRQPAVRAHLEQPLRRPRADHHGRGHRAGRARRLLRRHRRRPRRDPEPPAAAARVHRDGGADVVLLRRAARREDQGAQGDQAGRPAGGDHRPRAVHRRLAGRGEGARAARGGGVRPRVQDRDLRRHHLPDRHPPLGRGAVLPAHRQAAGPPRHRDRGGVQAGAAPALRRHHDRGARAERVRGAGAARRGRHDALRVEGAGQPDGGPRRHHGLRLRHRVHRGLPRGLRAPDPRRAARRAEPVPRQRGGRALLGDPRPRDRALGRAGHRSRPLPRGLVGPRVGRRDARPHRTHLAAPV